MKKFFCLLAALVCFVSVAAQSYSGTLPVLFINTENGAQITSKEDYINATYYLDNMGQADIEAIGSKEAPLAMEIRGRGNYTWTGFDKKPYRIKLGQKQKLMGMNKSKHFALLAHADDNYGFMRNAIGFQLSRMIGLPWTPADAPLEVVLNGEYIGLYFLTETVRIDSDRVNIVEQADNITDPEAITGGWLVEIDNYSNDPHISIKEKDENQTTMIFTYKTPEVLSQAQIDYLTSEMSAINDAIYIDDLNDNSWEELVDAATLARNYIVQELVDDYESFHGSGYLYKDLGEGQKWHFAPVWDFGNAFTEDKNRPFYEGRTWHNHWIPQVCRHPHFVEIVKEIWQEFYTNTYPQVADYVDSYATKIAEAAKCDYARWPNYGNQDIAERASKVKSRLTKSARWMNQQFGDGEAASYTVRFKDNVTPAWEQVYAYSWYMDGGNAIQLLGSWPGTELQKDGDGYYICTLTEDPLPEGTMIIFGDGDSGEGHQTADLKFVPGATYNRDGIVAGINDILADPTTDHQIYNLMGQPCTLPLPAGIYIINGQKVLIK